MAPPATEGGLEEPFETMEVQSRTDVQIIFKQEQGAEKSTLFK